MLETQQISDAVLTRSKHTQCGPGVSGSTVLWSGDQPVKCGHKSRVFSGHIEVVIVANTTPAKHNHRSVHMDVDYEAGSVQTAPRLIEELRWSCAHTPVLRHHREPVPNISVTLLIPGLSSCEIKQRRIVFLSLALFVNLLHNYL